MENNKEKASDLRQVANYPRQGRKAFFKGDGTIAKIKDKDGRILPAIKDMSPTEKKKYGRQPERMD